MINYMGELKSSRYLCAKVQAKAVKEEPYLILGNHTKTESEGSLTIVPSSRLGIVQKNDNWSGHSIREATVAATLMHFVQIEFC